MKGKRDFKGIWIPAEIWLSTELTLQEKVFLAEIDSLDNEDGCYANNEYFAKFFGISKTRVSIVINELVKKNYITSTIIYKEGTKQILKRVLNISYIGYVRKVKEGIQEKFKDNNTVNNTFNNTFNKEESEKQVFAPSLETKGTKPKRKKKPELNKIYPASFTPNVISLLEEYIEMRKQIGKALKSQIAFTRLCNECEKILTDYGQAVLENSIEISIASQWQSIYPKQLTKTINNGKTTNGINTKRQETIDWLNECYLDPNSL